MKHAILATLTLLVVTQLGAAARVQTPAEGWTSSKLESRFAFVAGFQNGVLRAVTEMARIGDTPGMSRESRAEISRRISLIADSLTTDLDMSALIEVMTAQYANPANQYVEPEDMILIARDILGGNDVAERVRTARQAGLERWKPIMEKNKSER